MRTWTTEDVLDGESRVAAVVDIIVNICATEPEVFDHADRLIRSDKKNRVPRLMAAFGLYKALVDNLSDDAPANVVAQATAWVDQSETIANRLARAYVAGDRSAVVCFDSVIRWARRHLLGAPPRQLLGHCAVAGLGMATLQALREKVEGDA